MLQIQRLFLNILLVPVLFSCGLLHEDTQIAKKIGATGNHPPEEWFTQYLDHFNPTCLRKWKQRYFTNDQYYKPDGPVFLMIGGEEEARVEWMTNGAWIDYAKRFGALCFFLEHRFYGKSHPTEDKSTKNLQYFTIEQALSDLATFIAAMNKKYNLAADIKWIAFGGSYPGSLASWVRLKYPHLVHGAVSSSSVVITRIGYNDYFRVIAEVLNSHSADCERAVRYGTMEINELMKSKGGNDFLNEKFKLCDPIENSVNNQHDMANLHFRLAVNFAFLQFNNINLKPIYGNYGWANVTLDVVCDIMTDKHKKSFAERLSDINSLFLLGYKKPCFDYRYDKMIEVGRNVSWDAVLDSYYERSWWYQLCTEILLFQTSPSERETFGKFPLEFFIDSCMDLFGPEFNSTFMNRALQRMETIYGGFNLTVTNVVVVQGSQDPWHLAAILKNFTDGPSVIFINGTAHGADMMPPSKDDFPQLRAAREQIVEHIWSWLQQ